MLAVAVLVPVLHPVDRQHALVRHGDILFQSGDVGDHRLGDAGHVAVENRLLTLSKGCLAGDGALPFA